MAPARGKKARGSEAPAASSLSEEGILARISSAESIAGLLEQVRSYLIDGSKNAKGSEGHTRAKKLVPFLGSLLRLCNAELRKVPADGDATGYQRGNEIFQIVAVALDTLDSLRTWITGGVLEIEMQRYGFVRRLIAWKKYREAADECRALLMSLKARVMSSYKEAQRSAKKSAKQILAEKLVLPAPNDCKEMMAGLPVLVIALVADLILYSIESGERDSDVLNNFTHLPLQLEPWLSVLNDNEQEKHRDCVFRALYRSSSILISDSKFSSEPELLVTFCTITLIWCSTSSQIDQYLKVARKFCSSTHTVIAVDISSFVIRSLRSKPVLHLVSREMLEESASNIHSFMMNTRMPSDELRGLISISYNIGVQVYNNKEYESACKPLKIAHDGAWTRVDFLSMIADDLVVGAVSEACVKTSAFVDCLLRSSNGTEDVVKDVLRNSLIFWLKIHSRGFKLERPRVILKLWCKVTLESAPEICCLYAYFSDLRHSVQAASLGLLLEEQILALDDMDKQNFAVIDKIKEELVDFLANEIYNSESFAADLLKVLIEKSRIARKKGVDNLGTSIALLSKGLQHAESAVRNSGDEKEAKLEHERAVAYCLRAHCSQEVDPLSEDYLEDLSAAVKSWRKFLDFVKATGDIEFANGFARTKYSDLILLRSTADLLSLKALSSLQNEMQLLMFEFILYWQTTYKEMRFSIWEDARISHVLCPVPFSQDFDSVLRSKFGEKVDALYDFDASTNSIATARRLLYSGDLWINSSTVQAELDAAIVSARASAPNNLRDRVLFSGLQFYLAEVFMQRGDLEMAIKYGADSLQLRLKLLNRTFDVTKAVDGSRNYSTSKVSKIKASGVSSVLTWPSLVSSSNHHGFSQWHILGDYIESLMQAGTVHEKLGFSDEAERSFREGLWLAQAQNLPLACIRFSSALGEVYRKQHLWDFAEECFFDAERLLEDLDVGSVCASCIALERCQLRLRVGDFTRRSLKPEAQSSQTRTEIALMHYQHALEALTELPFLKDILDEVKHISTTALDLKASLSAWTGYKWEFYGRVVAAKLFTEQGSCNFFMGDLLKAEKSYSHATQILSLDLDMPDTNVDSKASLFPLEEASLLYHWTLLRLWEIRMHGNIQNCLAKPIRNWLHRAFCLSNASSPLFRKVSQLLSLLHALPHTKSSEMKELSVYFHQASVGSTSRQQHLLVLNSKLEQDDAKTYLREMRQALRVLREGSIDLIAELNMLGHGLPPATICCISLVDQDFSFLLEPADAIPVVASLLISRIGGGNVVVTILPIFSSDSDSVLEVSQVLENRWRHKSVLESDSLLRNVMGELASILDESRQSTSRLLPVSTSEDKSQWWKWRTQLDTRLASCLRNIEKTWFGFWKCLLLGEPAETSVLEAFRKKSKELCRTLKSKSFTGQLKASKVPDEALVKVLLQGVESLDDEQLRQGISFILGWNIPFEERQDALLDKAVEVFRSSFTLALNGESSAGNTKSGRKSPLPAASKGLEREPVELVLDGKLQAFPWESLPFMRKFETYRMPSLGTIKAVFIHHRHSLVAVEVCDQLGALQLDARPRKNVVRRGARPTVNPHSTFYLLNPAGDLETTQTAFEEWFRRQKGWEGKAGQVPTIDEYITGFQQHEMFVYLGHGSGDQYFPEKYMRKLESCPASLLMGCSSGRFSSRGDYEPVGVPLSYLMASCPLAVANLWDVTDGDIDRFSRAVLQRWLESCGNEVRPPENKKNLPRRGRSSSKASREIDASASEKEEWEEFCIGPSIEAGREACRLPYLIGASPVCFGVPTVIRRSKTNIQAEAFFP